MESFISIHGDRLVALLTRILGDPHAASDAAQETWVAIWRARDRLLAGVDPWPFIRRTGVRKAIDRQRTEARVVRPLDANLLDRREGPHAAEPLDLPGLAAEERACLTLFFVEGCSVREIALQLAVPEGTVKSWMFRARAKLRERYGKEGRS